MCARVYTLTHRINTCYCLKVPVFLCETIKMSSQIFSFLSLVLFFCFVLFCFLWFFWRGGGQVLILKPRLVLNLILFPQFPKCWDQWYTPRYSGFFFLIGVCGSVLSVVFCLFSGKCDIKHNQSVHENMDSSSLNSMSVLQNHFYTQLAGLQGDEVWARGSPSLQRDYSLLWRCRRAGQSCGNSRCGLEGGLA